MRVNRGETPRASWRQVHARLVLLADEENRTQPVASVRSTVLLTAPSPDGNSARQGVLQQEIQSYAEMQSIADEVTKRPRQVVGQHQPGAILLAGRSGGRHHRVARLISAPSLRRQYAPTRHRARWRMPASSAITAAANLSAAGKRSTSPVFASQIIVSRLTGLPAVIGAVPKSQMQGCGRPVGLEGRRAAAGGRATSQYAAGAIKARQAQNETGPVAVDQGSNRRHALRQAGGGGGVEWRRRRRDDEATIPPASPPRCRSTMPNVGEPLTRGTQRGCRRSATTRRRTAVHNVRADYHRAANASSVMVSSPWSVVAPRGGRHQMRSPDTRRAAR